MSKHDSNMVISSEMCKSCFKTMANYSNTISPVWNTTVGINDTSSLVLHAFHGDIGPSSPQTIIILSILFFFIGIVGILGNSLVIFSVVFNKKMRTSMTNLLITNLAFSDLVIILFGIPETIQFMMNKGWILSDVCCKINRFILVTSLYGSVLTLMALCVER